MKYKIKTGIALLLIALGFLLMYIFEGKPQMVTGFIPMVIASVIVITNF